MGVNCVQIACTGHNNNLYIPHPTTDQSKLVHTHINKVKSPATRHIMRPCSQCKAKPLSGVLQVPWQGPKWELAVACGSLQSGRADWLVEKSTELGAWSLRPVVTERSPGIGPFRHQHCSHSLLKHLSTAISLLYMLHCAKVKQLTRVSYVPAKIQSACGQDGKVLARQAKETVSRGQAALLGGSVLLMQPPSNPSGT